MLAHAAAWLPHSKGLTVLQIAIRQGFFIAYNVDHCRGV
jgi:hypothetical protein